jgi:hypothetical protein
LYFAVDGTRRVDLGESVVALLSTEGMAREIGRRLVAQRPWLLRCRVRQVFLTFNQTAEIVGLWGREDGARGQSVAHADRIMAPYREVYLAGYRAGLAAYRPADGRAGRS